MNGLSAPDEEKGAGRLPPVAPPPSSNNSNRNHNGNNNNNSSSNNNGSKALRFDPLAPSPDATPSSTISSKHMQTYTAGEDVSRLAAAARELGLQQARRPRRQVRKEKRRRHHHRRASLHHPADVLHLLLETTTEDARMRAIYSAHEDREARSTSVPYFLESLREGVGEDEYEEEDGEGAFADAHAEGIGGDLPAAVLGIIKGMVGPAILYLPHGFASAGYGVALPIMVVTTTMFLYSSTCLLEAWKEEDEKSNGSGTSNSNPAVTTETSGLLEAPPAPPPKRHTRVMLSYPELAYRALGPTGESLVKTGIALMQSGVCLTYLIFVPQNLHASFFHLFHWNISPSLWLVLMIALQLPLSWIRDIRKLTPTNLAANCCILYGLFVCLYYAVEESLSGPPQSSPLANLWDHLTDLSPAANGWFLFIGTSVLLFEGSITLLVPLQEAVDTEEERAAFPAVYKRVILCIICFYAFFGITCWMAFGDAVRTVLTTSLPDTNLSTTVQLAYSVAVIFTFPLQNFPALEITTRTVQASKACASCRQKSDTGGSASFWASRNFLSSLMVIGLAVVAVGTMDSLDKVVSLMGSLLGCPIAFVFPPLIHSQVATDLTPRRLWCNRIVAALGVGAMVMASLTTLLTWN